MNAPIAASAPGRINLIGEHTDYNNGFAMPIALPMRTHVEFVPDSRAAIAITATDYGRCDVALDTKPGEVDGWAAYPAGVMWALSRNGITFSGGEMTIRSDIPVGAGLSSSAALECAVLAALTSQHPLTPFRAAQVAQQAENLYVNAPTGLLDQVASMCARTDHALLIDFDSYDIEYVPFAPADHGLDLVVIDSRSTHGHVGGEYADRRASCERAAAALGVLSLRHVDSVEQLGAVADATDRVRARHIVTENARVLDAASALRANDFRAFGTLMNESHTSMRDDFAITTPFIDSLAQSARDHGALGARMTGGGFGGCVIAVMPAGAVDGLIATLTGGDGCPRVFTALASGPARASTSDGTGDTRG